MLNELVKIVEPQEDPSEEVFYYDKYTAQIDSLGNDLNEETRKVQYSYKEGIVLVQGIPEDFKVFLNGVLVCECVYGHLENINKKMFILLVE